MSSVLAMAPALHSSPRPQSAYELDISNASFFNVPQHRRSGSEAATSPSSLAPTRLETVTTAFGGLEFPLFNTDFELDTSIFAKGKPSHSSAQSSLSPSPKIVETTSRLDAELPQRPSLLRSKKSSFMGKSRSWLNSAGKSSKSQPSSPDNATPTAATPDAPWQQPPAPQLERSLTTSESFASFAKRSWISKASRSPTTKTEFDESAAQAPKGREDSSQATTPKAAKQPHPLHIITNQDQIGDANGLNNNTTAASFFPRIKPRQHSTFGRDATDSDNSCASSATSFVRTSNSTRTSASQSTCSEGNTNTPVSDDSCNERSPVIRDPLWSMFKALDLEVRGLNPTKQTAQRVAQVQSKLLPFLRSTRDHPSVKAISLEDVERRAAVLNKWWTLLLDMLQGQVQQPIAGMDRPMLLEAATMLMMRPEWRQSGSSMQTLADRARSEPVRSRSWTNESNSEMVAESAEHNVRTMFVSNLVRQMAYVVEKMSLRHAPLSLVNFSGKTCAYAFFFAPGVADVLVRLWGLTPELIRRTGTGLGLGRKGMGTGSEKDDIVSLFPPSLRGLGWSSSRAMWDSLKQIPKMPLLVARIPWTGPWVGRWKGRDTDLFFIFCKYFHVLADQFMPPELPLAEKARSPAFALVHAQLLSVFDSIIHRQAGVDQSLTTPLIDSVTGPDASATAAMPFSHTNLMKNMGENRLVILLKDFLTEESAEIDGARHTFAEVFAALMKTATLKTSLFDTAACATLCDFLEEVLVVYHDFESFSNSHLDWAFWIEVCKKMSGSMNTMTEVRLLSFLYTVWDALAGEPQRKVDICLDWLLTEQTFNNFFNNWCPMVRAYYQRLICWRMCRYTGGSDEADLNIYLTATARLKTTWAHYLYLKQDADDKGRSPLSTAPMSPAVGKKFMIIRQEINTSDKGLFMGFDTFARMPTNSPFPGPETPDAGGLVRPDANKKRWSLIGKVRARKNNHPSQGPSGELSKSFSDPSSLGREPASLGPAATSLDGTRPGLAARKLAPSGGSASAPSPVCDEQRYIFKFILGWQQNPGVARERVLTRPRLPLPTQARITAWSHNVRATLPSPSSQTPHASAQTLPETPRSLLLHGKKDDIQSLTASVEEWLRHTPTSSLGFEGSVDKREGTVDGRNDTSDDDDDGDDDGSNQGPVDDSTEDARDQLTRPVKPSGIFSKNAVYCGRALAEWSQVVSECNIFTERRQDDGVERLSDVEVPSLGVDGFRKLSA